MNIPVLKTMSALVLSTLAFGGLAQTKGVTPAETNYQAGGSPLAVVPMYQSSNPKAPPMTQAEFDLARKTYFQRFRNF